MSLFATYPRSTKFCSTITKFKIFLYYISAIPPSENRGLETSIFVGGEVDTTLSIYGGASARFGKELFNRCFTKYRNEFPVQVYSHGRLWLGARIFATNVRIEEPGYGRKQHELVFNIDIRLNAKIVR